MKKMMLGLGAAMLGLCWGAVAAQGCYRGDDSDGVFAAAAAAPVLPEVLQQQVREGKAMQRCYARALRRDPGLHGEVWMGVRLDAQGQVDRAVVLKSDHNDPLLHSCLGELVCALRGPAGGQSSLHVQSFGLDEEREQRQRPGDMVGSRRR